jgi:hemerythrin superfamily protein
MNAIKFLINEHHHVRVLLKDIGDKSHRGETKKKMFDQLSRDLIRHESMEQHVWYPRFKNSEKIDDTVKHLITEENKAELAIKSFENIKTEAAWDKKFAEFKKEVEHHAAEEEEKLFPKIEHLLTVEELEEIGKEMEIYKQKH